jgi:putative ABC transport system permease protein
MSGGLTKEAEIIGVFEDFHNMPFLNGNGSVSESETGRGIVFLYKGLLFDDLLLPEVISIKVSPQAIRESLESLERHCRNQFPGMIFSWSFAIDRINSIYAQEKIDRNQIILFTSLAVLISCLGMLGMISYKATDKTKEIGIRKVLGARLHQIAHMLLNTSIRHVILATMIGIPVAYFLSDLYLQKYSERIHLQWWHFATPILMLVGIMFLSIVSVLWKAAKNNPVEALKCE